MVLGMPRAEKRLMQRTAIAASTFWRSKVRERRLGPMRVGEAGEDLLVEAFVAKPAVEALDEAVLLRLAGGDLVPQRRRTASPSSE
jgi:hypothetical protein